MLSKGLERLALIERWIKTETRIHGEYRGYWINAGGELGTISLEAVYPFTPVQLEALLARLQAITVPKLKTEAIGNERAISFHLTGRADLLYDEVKHVLDQFCDALLEVGVPPELGCGSCGKLGSYPLAELGPEKTFPMCEACFKRGETDLAEAQQRLEHADFQYVRGIIGAVIGGLIASIPWLALTLAGLPGALLGYYVGKGVFRGYVARGQIGPHTAKLLVGVTGCLVVVAHMVGLRVTGQTGSELPYLSVGLFTAGLGLQHIILDIKEGTTVPKLRRFK